MSKVTMETLEKSFKKNIANLFSEVIRKTFNGGLDDETHFRLSAAMETYCDELFDAIEECGGDTDVIERWAIEALNDVRLGDLIGDLMM